MTAQYVYGVADADMELPTQLRGLGGRTIRLIPHERFAAVVSELEPDRPLGTGEDLLSHGQVLDALAAAGQPVLPFRFGAVLTDAEAVQRDLLAPNADRFAHDYGKVAGRVELILKGTYVEEAVLPEVLEEEPEVQRLRGSLRDVPEDAAYYDRIRLGELIAAAFTRKAAHEASMIFKALEPYAVAVAPREPSQADEIIDAAFLVPHEGRKSFEQKVQELARGMTGRVRLRLLGPHAPYDFVGGNGESR